MKDGLKNLLYQAIRARYPNMLRKDEAEQLCKENNYNWGDNGTSRLREMSRGDCKSIQKIKNDDGVIIGYKLIPVTTFLEQEKPSNPLDDQLRALIKGRTMDEMRKINEAFKKPDWYKRGVIKELS
jgi:hypothetical protein